MEKNDGVFLQFRSNLFYQKLLNETKRDGDGFFGGLISS